MPEIKLKEKKIPYSVKISSRRKTLGIIVDNDSGLSITIPPDTSEDEIERVLQKKSDWILNKLNNFEEMSPNSLRVSFSDVILTMSMIKNSILFKLG